ncbi:amidohydrolase [Streptomyces sp. SID3343]|uniref:amidohydrolase n=1 Tax=Streptomyces sp. SID3343 TaxID=2690260 RepID=UPI00136F6ACC|nr:amidohydrolase [Streptomyces sp. SID3343]MYV96762.1 amidohydrolase family protein [Streptomyces sp. SID3343]
MDQDTPSADLVLIGTVITVDDDRPRAEAVAVLAGRVLAVGSASDMPIGPNTHVVDLGDRCVLPGFVEAHGHVVAESVLFDSGAVVDIRPTTMASAAEVVSTIRRGVADGHVIMFGWDPMSFPDLPLASQEFLGELAPESSLVVVHHSGHVAWFNHEAARVIGIGTRTPDPSGGRYGRDARGALNGSAYGVGAMAALTAPYSLGRDGAPPDLTEALARMSAVGLTMVSEMACQPAWRDALLDPVGRTDPTLRLRLYEPTSPELRSAARPFTGDDLVRQTGIKVWVDGSPWAGTIAVSFPYLDTELTHRLGRGDRPHASTNYTWDQLAEVVEAYFPHGWQIACHAHGDLAIDMILDVYEGVLSRYPRADHRLRLEHVGAMRPDQFTRAAALGVTASVFMDHVYYWGEVLTDELFGPKYGAHWAAAGSAVAAGLRISLHNDPPSTPENPLHNITVATTRRSRGGRVLAPEECLTVDQAIRAQTLDAAYQLFSDDITGSITPGKYADLVVLSADPYTVPLAAIADLDVLATFLAGRQTHGRAL